MQLLLYSDYFCLPNDQILKALKNKKRPLTCLFCSYAEEGKSSYYKRTTKHLKEVFDNIIELYPGYKFNNNLDAIFVNGGSNFELVYKLKKYNQFNKIKELVDSGVLYIGNSAGSLLCSKSFLWASEYEPPEIEECKASENCEGFGYINKNILAHASKYKLRNNKLIFNKTSWKIYRTIKLKQPNPLKIPNNGVYIFNDKVQKLKVYPWKALIKNNQN